MEKNLIDNLLPKEIAIKAENIGVKKGNLDFFSMLVLSILAGAYIASGAAFYTEVISGNGFGGSMALPPGIIKLLGGMAFSLGLILVVIAGGELFTGNVLVFMAAASRKLSFFKVLYTWVVVYIGNFIGAVITAQLIFLTGHFKMLNGVDGVQAMTIAIAKCELPFYEALTRGIFCNLLVCIAVWLTFSGRTITDKILALIFPITAFVALGFEHSVANMYFIPLGIFIKDGAGPDFWAMLGNTPLHLDSLSWENFLYSNLPPVTLGNIIGGIIVGMGYWLIYCRPNILDVVNEESFLRRLIKVGRRGLERFDVEGTITLKSDSRSVKGKFKDVSLSGVSGIFHSSDVFQGKNEKLMIDLESHDNKLCILGMQGIVVRKKFVDPQYVEIAVQFTDEAYEKKNEVLNYINMTLESAH